MEREVYKGVFKESGRSSVQFFSVHHIMRIQHGSGILQSAGLTGLNHALQIRIGIVTPEL